MERKQPDSLCNCFKGNESVLVCNEFQLIIIATWTSCSVYSIGRIRERSRCNILVFACGANFKCTTSAKRAVENKEQVLFTSLLDCNTSRTTPSSLRYVNNFYMQVYKVNIRTYIRTLLGQAVITVFISENNMISFLYLLWCVSLLFFA